MSEIKNYYYYDEVGNGLQTLLCLQKSCLPLSILCVELSRFRSIQL